jgi:translocation and assembly module TamA
VRVGRAQETPRFDRLYYLEQTHTRLEGGDLVNTADATTANVNWIRRRLDSVLLPTRGDTLSLQGAAGYGFGRLTVDGAVEKERGPFSRLYGRYTLYQPFGNGWYSTFRAEAGQVLTRSKVYVPDTALFRAGGDESVRGYGYRTLGPVNDGVIVSGKVLLTGSAEIARPISPKYPAFWWATFVDVGNAADNWKDLNPAVGYGVGLRWRSPVGPLRVDLAYGQRVQQVRVHLSVGVAF